MTENQKLREALHLCRSALGHLGISASLRKAAMDAANQALALPPNVPETDFGKMREALQALITATDHAAYGAALSQARQALALPTAEQVGDINVVESFTSVTKTAAPVGERDLPQLPDPTYIYHDAEQGEDDLFEFSESGAVDEGCPKCKRLYTADQMRAYARAALSAGDAVDAQRYRWLAPSESDVNTSRSTEHMEAIITAWSALLDLCGSCKGEIDAAIDAAMRKGQL